MARNVVSRKKLDKRFSVFFSRIEEKIKRGVINESIKIRLLLLTGAVETINKIPRIWLNEYI